MAITLAEMLVRLGIDDQMSRGLDTAAGKLSSFGSAAVAIGGILTASVTAPLVALGAASLSAAADMDTLKRGLVASTGSVAAAEDAFARLREIAKLPGLGLEEAAKGFISLSAAGLSAAQAEASLKAFGNALATVGKGRADLDGVVLALTQIASAPILKQQDLNQLFERLPQLRKILLDLYGTFGAQELTKRGIFGERFVEEVTEAFAKLPAVTGGFKNDLENMRDTIRIALADIGAALLPFASAILGTLAPALQGLSAWFTSLSPSMQTFVVASAGVAAALGPVLLAVGGLAQGLALVLPFFAQGSAGAAVLGTALGGLVNIAAIGVTAFAAWNIGAWAYNSIPGVKALGDGIAWLVTQTGNLLAKLPGITSVDGASSQMLSDATGKLEQLASRLNVDFQALNQQYRTGAISLEAYNSALNKMVLAKMGASTATTKTTSAVEGHSAAIKIAVPSLKQMQDAIEAYQPTVKRSELLEAMAAELKARHAKAVRDLALSYIDAEARIATFNATIAAGAAGMPDLSSASSGVAGMGGIDEIIKGQMDQAVGAAQAQFPRIEAASREGAEKAKEPWRDFSREIDKAFDRMSRGMARAIVEWDGFGNTLKDIGKSFLTGMLEISFQKILDPIKQGLTDALFGSQDSGGGGGLFGGLLGGLGDAIGGLFGKGGKGGFFGKLFGGFGGLFGGGGGGSSTQDLSGYFNTFMGGGGGAAGGAGGGALGGAISNPYVAAAIGGAQLLSGLVTGFRQEGTLNQIERNTAAASIHLMHTLEKANETWPGIGLIHDFLWNTFLGAFVEMLDATKAVRDMMAGSLSLGQQSGVPPVINGHPVYFVVPDEASLDRLMALFAQRVEEVPA